MITTWRHVRATLRKAGSSSPVSKVFLHRRVLGSTISVWKVGEIDNSYLYGGPGRRWNGAEVLARPSPGKSPDRLETTVGQVSGL